MSRGGGGASGYISRRTLRLELTDSRSRERPGEGLGGVYVRCLLFFPCTLFPPAGRSSLQDVRQEEWPVNLFPRLQLKHTCHQSTPIKCSIKHWLRPRSAARLLQLLMRRLPCCHFCAFSFCFSVCLPACLLPACPLLAMTLFVVIFGHHFCFFFLLL